MHTSLVTSSRLRSALGSLMVAKQTHFKECLNCSKFIRKNLCPITILAFLPQWELQPLLWRPTLRQNQNSYTLSMDHWLNGVCHAHRISITYISFQIPSRTFLFIHSLHSPENTFLAAFTLAPFCSRTFATSLCPYCADMYKGVAPL